MEVGTCMFQPKLLFFLVVGNQTVSSGKERRISVAAATRRTKKEKKRGKTFTFALLLSSLETLPEKEKIRYLRGE